MNRQITRQDCYDACIRRVPVDGRSSVVRNDVLLPKEAIDKIIDCAVYEALKDLRDTGGIGLGFGV